MSIFISVCYYATSATAVNEIVLHNAIKRIVVRSTVLSVVISIRVQLIRIPYMQAVKVRNSYTSV